MSSNSKKQPKKEKEKPSFVPRPSIFEQRTGQKGANVEQGTIGDAPSDMRQLEKAVRDLRRVLKKSWL
ncbi:hypothetical protein [Acetobacter cerevisiae]|uniref:hypothetical protein n=1 Tax=Acetobacter cerevisiae TaxID=178900 RepID=UPI00209D5EBF|nr:hypothetical protein [Acetobacter cerevisiae]MCP1271239.1 hypothetical protein [Acetobacter cerevisiae]MCP1279193.1 hypothetical protein [Acetobacter cerevisiae]